MLSQNIFPLMLHFPILKVIIIIGYILQLKIKNVVSVFLQQYDLTTFKKMLNNFNLCYLNA